MHRVMTPLASCALLACGTAWSQTNGATSAQQPAPNEVAAPAAPSVASVLGADAKAYFTAPLHWDGGDWAWFGGALLAVGAAHHYDSEVRTHFVKNLAPGEKINSNDAQDAIPTVVVLAATWGYADLIGSESGRTEAWNMFEAAGLSTVTAYATKYLSGRQGPDETDSPNEWFKGGAGTFPSWHSTAAFAVGTVLAESGNDDYRWVRRILGYGLGAGTSYLRLKHNAHWLSDTVAGAALGIATAHFVMDRREGSDGGAGGLTVEPVPGGVMVAYRLSLP